MKKLQRNSWLLAIMSGILLIPGWYENGTGLTLLVAFLPILHLIEKYSDEKCGGRKVFLFSNLAFLIWNIGTTWWIYYALVDGKPSFAGVGAAVLLSSFFMSIAVWLAYKTRKALGKKIGHLAFILFWLAYEFSYTNGEVSWPWLTLGNGFAYEVKLIQWYELTGVFGGTLWVLFCNVLIYKLISSQTQISLKSKPVLIILSVIFIPIFFSVIRYNTYHENNNPRKIVVIQPNVDPYLKFNDIPSIEQTNIQVKLAEQLIDSTVDYVVAPETSIMNNIWIGRFNEVEDFILVDSLLSKYPKAKYVTGIMCYKSYEPGEKLTATAKKRGDSYYYDSFNSAVQIDSTDSIQLYHKSKLVVGVEKMPYPGILKILKPITMELGGTFRSHATQKDRSVFVSSDGKDKVAPVICYESVYGEFVTDYIKKGAGLIIVITNDGWWDNTPGHRQHNSLSSIRAIETRRSVARSANTGISSFINQRGDVIQKTKWWKETAIKDSINYNDKITLYVRIGDIIGRIGFYSGLILILFMMYKYLMKKIHKKR